jgi:outer membrane immunogenic protein
MKRLILALAAALSLAASGEAIADGYAKKAPAAALDAPRPWTGFYLGGGIGSGAVVHDLTIDVPGVVNVLGFDGVGGEGIFGTVIAGYDHQLFPGIIVGIFADYDFSNISTDLSVIGSLFNASLEHKNSWSIGGRAGFLSSPSTLWYGTAGYTQANFDLTSSAGSLDIPEFKGYFLGAGVESHMVGNWSLRAEYRFTRFDRETVFSVPGLTDLGLEPSMHTARLALTYKFSRREEVPAPLK